MLIRISSVSRWFSFGEGLFRNFIPRLCSIRQMSELLFIQQVNPVSGETEWKTEGGEYDYAREIARSSYADMLHDTERNKMYYKAIRLAVEDMHRQGKKAKVLDIGTGTGLLSMMAATAGAEQITAIEVFSPMARVARAVTKRNGFSQINVINKHSTEVKLGKDGDMKEKANILVTELFDTELIGEGALLAYHHAHQNLMEEDCIAVPHSATTYVQLVESDLMYSWHALKPVEVKLNDGDAIVIEPDPAMKECPGVPAVHDIQLSQIKRSQFQEITKPLKVFQFDWGSKLLSPSSRTYVATTEAISTGKAQVILSWWTLSMDTKGDIVLSTAPYWHHPTPGNMQWRDHWIQSVYFLPQTFEVSKGDLLAISAYHDAYSMWFDADLHNKETNLDKITRPVCSYLPRMLWSRPRLGMLNDKDRNASFTNALRKIEFGDSKPYSTICISDGSLIPLLVSCFSKGEVFTLESGQIAQRGIQNLVRHNKMSDNVTVINVETLEEDLGLPIPKQSIDLLISEPYFNNSTLPWLDLKFWYARSHIDKYLKFGARVMPVRGRLCIAAVNFNDLWKIRAPVKVVEGFDVSIMDDMINEAMEAEDYHEPEPHALWEYPNTLLSSAHDVMVFDFTKPAPMEEVHVCGLLALEHPLQTTCHGIVLWMEYDLDDEITLSSGLLNRSDAQSKTMWNMHYKQGVFFLRQPIDVVGMKSTKIQYEISFIPETLSMRMRFLADTFN